MIHDENRKSVENDVYMFIAILYRILPSDLSWVLLERITYKYILNKKKHDNEMKDY